MAIILAVIALLTSIFILPPVICGIPAIIISIAVLKNNEGKVLAISSIVISSMSILIAIVVAIVLVFLPNDEMMTNIDNGVSNGIIEQISQTNKLAGNNWKMGDDSLLELNEDGTFYWYKTTGNKSDKYYYGTYSTKFGDDAIEKIDEVFGWEEEAFKTYGKTLRTDVYYLELTNQKLIVDGIDKLDEGEKITRYYIVFEGSSTVEAKGVNLGTHNRAYFTKYE